MRAVKRSGYEGLVLAAALVLAARVPALRAALPALGLLTGPLGFGLIGLSLSGLLAAPLGWLARRTPSAPGLFAGTAVVLVTLGLWQAHTTRVSGDEPHYLLMAQSLWREGDLDLRDEFARGDFREYLPDLAGPHYGAPRADGRPFPAHSPGLPLLLAPVYAAFGRAGCVALMSLLAAATAAQAFRLALRFGAQPAEALFAWAVCAGPPAVFYAAQLYTETPSALLIVSALLALLGAPSVAGAAGAALLTAALPWLHLKMIPAAAALGVLALLRLRGAPRWAFLGTATLAAAAFLGYYQLVFGRPTPLALYGGGLPQGDVVPDPLRAGLGLLLDRSFGLLPVAPAFLLALAAGRPARASRGELWALCGLLLVVAAPALAWRMWWGGQCPPARFLVPLLPLLAPLVAGRLARSDAGLARWRFGLLYTGVGLAAFALLQPARMLLLNRRDRPTRLLDALGGEVSPERYLPSLVYAPPQEWRVAWLWAATLALVLLLDRLALRHQGLERVWRSPLLPLALGLGLVLAVDLWGRPGAPDARQPAPGTSEPAEGTSG